VSAGYALTTKRPVRGTKALARKSKTATDRVGGAPDGRTCVTHIADGASARIVELSGGQHMVGKLTAMGFVRGAVITKKSTSLMQGPIVLQKGQMQIAIGHGMAQRIIVEPLSSEDR
jgi:Fe2+ transport system protein FeoA